MQKADKRVFTGDWPQYRDNLKAYYDRRRLSDPFQDGDGGCDPEKIRSLIRSHHVAGDWRFEIIEHLRRAMADRKVLELGCGYGYWTYHLADVAERVLATDISEPGLANARLVVDASNVEFKLQDASDVSDLTGSFDAVVSVNMINHFPREVALAMVQRINARLGAGGRVFLAGEHYYGWRRMMYRKPGAGDDFVSARADSDAGAVEIVDDPYEPDDIRRLIGARASDVFVGDCLGYWWVRYTVCE